MEKTLRLAGMVAGGLLGLLVGVVRGGRLGGTVGGLKEQYDLLQAEKEEGGTE